MLFKFLLKRLCKRISHNFRDDEWSPNITISFLAQQQTWYLSVVRYPTRFNKIVLEQEKGRFPLFVLWRLIKKYNANSAYWIAHEEERYDDCENWDSTCILDKTYQWLDRYSGIRD